ncbi:MAG: hypothetical protein HY597_07110 [Candidatus Omnitrophica bacterium]|nr:hypothetical protein [Candidatus Omnitrophota bacterium]
MNRTRLLWGVGVVAAGLWCLGGPVQAHQNRHDADQFVEQLEKKLHLTPDQTTEAQEIAEQTAKQRRALYDQCNTQLQQLQRSKFDRIEALLTPDQRPEFSKIRAKHEAKQQEKAATRAKKQR